jgi:hypothetical protein
MNKVFLGIIAVSLTVEMLLIILFVRKYLKRKKKREKYRQDIQQRMNILAQLEEKARSEKVNQQMKETTATLDAGFSQENEFSLLTQVFVEGFGRKKVEVDQ